MGHLAIGEKRMMKKDEKLDQKQRNVSRREVLKKTKASMKFVVPTIVTFELSKCEAVASYPPGHPSDY